LRNLFWAFFPDLGFKGIRLSLRGKISVAGNARSRALLYSIGHTSHSTLSNRVVSDFSTIESFTGVMGFRVSFYF
jgi:ribosomal protein S3